MKHVHKPVVTRGHTRRSFLLTLAAGLASAGIYGCQTGPAANKTIASGRWPAWLEGLIGDPEAAARLGNAYLVTHPDENSSATLSRLLDQAIASESTAIATLTTEQIAVLQHCVRTDYARNAVVPVNGWVLSITEARLYGLVAVLSGN